MSGYVSVNCTVNNNPIVQQLDADMSLLTFLRQGLGLTGTKNGCSTGSCGACTVILNGKAVRSCTVRMSSKRMIEARVETIEGLAREDKLHPLQSAFTRNGAVQCGFCTPGFIMSAKALLDAVPNPAEEEIKNHLTSNRNLCRCTGYIPIIRAIREVANTGMGENTYVDADVLLGEEKADQPLLRSQAIERVTGSLHFSDDSSEKGMLYGAILWSEYSHAEIISLDVSEAEANAGVVQVVTAQNIPGENLIGLQLPDQPAIALDKVRHRGEALAAVFGETEESARKGVEKIRVEYRELPGVFSLEEAARPEAPHVHPSGNLLLTKEINRGDVESAFAASANVVEHTFSTPHIEHGYMEPESGWGIPAVDGGVTVKIGSQSVFRQRDKLAALLNLPKEKVRVVQLPVGGAFGAKQDLILEPFLALGALLTGRPVKITLSRKESLDAHVKKHPAIMRYKAGTDEKGRLLAVEAEIDTDTGAYASLGRDVLKVMVHGACGCYFVPHVKVTGRLWYTNNIPCGAMRGFGANQVNFAMESIADELCRKLDMDPFLFREINGLEEGLATPTDHVLGPGLTSFKSTVSAVRKALQNSGKRKKTTGPKKIGIGVASAFRSFGYGNSAPEGAGAEVILHPSGKVKVNISQHELGQGAFSVLTRIAADELQIDPASIDVSFPDTSITPPTGPTSGSRQTFITGNALIEACRALKQEVFTAAADHLEADPAKLSFRDTRIAVSGSERAVELSELGGPFKISKTYHPPETVFLDDKGLSYFNTPEFTSRPVYYGYASTTQAVVVEVDTDTGAIKVLGIIAAVDIGRAINRGAVIGQIEGALMMGLGYALSERYILDKGVNRSTTLDACGLPRPDQTPEMITILIEKPHPEGPQGAKGFSEIPALATTPAIINAVHDATGVRIFDLPALGNKILVR